MGRFDHIDDRPCLTRRVGTSLMQMVAAGEPLGQAGHLSAGCGVVVDVTVAPAVPDALGHAETPCEAVVGPRGPDCERPVGGVGGLSGRSTLVRG